MSQESSVSTKDKQNDRVECQELKNIKYKSMLLSGTTPVINPTVSSTCLDKILEKESTLNKKEPWNKLDKTLKVKKINNYVDNILIKKFSLTKEETETTKQYLIQSLDRIKLQRVKDVEYNKETGDIKNIPCFTFNQKSRKFTLKRSDKRVSTLKSLSNPSNSKKNREKKKEKTNRSKTEKIDTKTT